MYIIKPGQLFSKVLVYLRIKYASFSFMCFRTSVVVTEREVGFIAATGNFYNFGLAKQFEYCEV